ncbi:MAG: RecX family transcriptional regulator [Phycisphaerae bacterium]|nr:RecX family transcriptional regulator [Phycisphaerae bacterium]
MARRRPMHPSDRRKFDRLLDAPTGGTLRLRTTPAGRVTMLINGRSIGTIAGDIADRIGLRSGRPWTPELALRVSKALEDDIAQEAATRLLAQRERSTGELIARLKRRGVKPDKAERLVASLEHKGEVDDARFAELLARSILRDKPAGARLIRSKLREKHVDRETARHATSAALQGRDALSDAIMLARSRLRAMGAAVDDRTKARRLLGLLARRGFEEDTAMSAVRSLLRLQDAES